MARQKARLYIMLIWSIEMTTTVNIDVTNRHLDLLAEAKCPCSIVPVTFSTDSATGSSQVLCGASCMALVLALKQ